MNNVGQVIDEKYSSQISGTEEEVVKVGWFVIFSFWANFGIQNGDGTGDVWNMESYWGSFRRVLSVGTGKGAPNGGKRLERKVVVTAEKLMFPVLP